jgi:drug/metabolite transporter (DMT)-like permease/DNA-binding MarR family transcriptional regulator
MDQLSNLVGALALAVTDAQRREMAEASGLGESAAAAVVTLGEYPGLSVAALAGIVGLTHSATVRLADDLGRRGLVLRTAGADRRSVGLRLTEDGAALRARLMAARAEVLRRATEAVAEGDRTVFTRGVTRVLRRSRQAGLPLTTSAACATRRPAAATPARWSGGRWRFRHDGRSAGSWAGVGPALAVAAMVGSAACWGGATVMTKGALAAVPPFTLLSIQLTASVTVLWVAVLLLRVEVGPLRPAFRRASTGVFEPGLAYAVGVPGLALTTAGNASVVAAMEPVFVILLVWVVFGLRPDRIVVGAVGVAVAGVCLVSLPDLSGLGAGDVRGDALVLLGTAFAAVYVVVSSRLVAATAPLVLSCLQQSVGLGVALLVLALALATGFEDLPGAVAPGMLLLAVGSGIIQYALAFWLYLVGLRRLPVGVAGLFLTLTPLFGLGGGMLVLGERIGAMQMLGAALILASVATVVTRSRG